MDKKIQYNSGESGGDGDGDGGGGDGGGGGGGRMKGRSRSVQGGKAPQQTRFLTLAATDE